MLTISPSINLKWNYLRQLQLQQPVIQTSSTNYKDASLAVADIVFISVFSLFYTCFYRVILSLFARKISSLWEKRDLIIVLLFHSKSDCSHARNRNLVDKVCFTNIFTTKFKKQKQTLINLQWLDLCYLCYVRSVITSQWIELESPGCSGWIPFSGIQKTYWRRVDFCRLSLKVGTVLTKFVGPSVRNQLFFRRSVPC